MPIFYKISELVFRLFIPFGGGVNNVLPKSQYVRYNGIPYIRNFMLSYEIIILHFFSCTVAGKQPRNVLPHFVATRDFLIFVFDMGFVFSYQKF
jgi:hypothetical protein